MFSKHVFGTRRCSLTSSNKPVPPTAAVLHHRKRSIANFTAGTSIVAVDEELVEEDFYSLLGVPPNADERTIRRAYLSTIKECHPDRSQDQDTTNFCALLNEIYETLTDPDRRMLYDDIAGFSQQAVNPFLDTSAEVDQVFVDEIACIGCRNCNNVCPRTFGIEEDWGRARAIAQNVDTVDKMQEAIDTCPVSCIHWVTAAQLPLLDAAMARMERTPVWAAALSSKAANVDVFREASMAWTKRRTQLQAVRAAATPEASRKSAWSFWGESVDVNGATGSAFYQQAAQARTQRATSVGSKEGRSVAALAARAARAARTWKQYQAVTSAARRSSQSLASASSSLASEDTA